ncbi:hypothetical protein N7452_000453 [Penicillium brevicompactum]|uniref:Uncharacterized protein n=1 Tax=Penicillium brevicompactum TaxID=5074 RepID=A0A9W9R2Q0_PENBR|nr:hypothetical protein N7452_000453 [Penicillium brevicompactum]
MPAPLAKGLIIGVSVLVAAGIAVYESPQFQQWVTTSRRKIALALHNLGDEIQPRDIPLREDISMTEEPGEIAEERRRIARAEIMRRGVIIESRRESLHPHQPRDSFDALVDKDGNLRDLKAHDGDTQFSQDSVARSTGIEPVNSGLVHRGGRLIDDDTPASTSVAKDPLHIQTTSPTLQNRDLQLLTQFTPTSDDADENPFFDPLSPNSPIESSGSSHTEDHEEVYYAHPDGLSSLNNNNNVLVELDGFGQGNVRSHHHTSSASSTNGSFSHVGGSDDGTSDGTLSDLGVRSVGGVATPASWSEVGSVISNEDAGHHPLL